MQQIQFVDTLLSLNDAAKGVLNRLHHLRQALSSPGARPSSFKDPDLKKLTVVLLKSYPVIPADVTAPLPSASVAQHGHQQAQQPLDPQAAYAKIFSPSNLTSYTRNIYDELSDAYQTLLLARNFQQKAFSVIQSAPMILNVIASYPPPFSLYSSTENASPTASLLILVCNFIKIHLSVHHIQDRKQVFVLYNLAHRALNNNNEHPDSSALSEFLTQCDTGMRHLQNLFLDLPENIPKCFSLIIGSIMPAAINTCGTVKDLITRGTIDILEDVDSLPLPTSIPNLSPLTLMQANQTHSWIALILLACPTTLVATPGISQSVLLLLKHVLSTSFVICIHRDLRLRLHDEFEELYSWWPPKVSKSSSSWVKACREEYDRLDTKPSKVVSQSAEEAIKTSALYHREYRSYLIQVMSSLFNMLKDEPGLLGPKAPVVIHVLNASKLEILWYFRHVPSACLPPKVSTGVILGIGASDARYDPTLFTDNFISFLMNLHLNLLEHVKENWWIIVKYHIEMCGISHLNYFKSVAQDLQQGSNSQMRSILPNIERIVSLLSGLPDLRRIHGVGPLENPDERRMAADLLFEARNEWNYALVELQHNGGFKSIESRKDSTTLVASLSGYKHDRASDILHRLAIFSCHAQFISEGESLLISTASLGDMHFEKDAVNDAFQTALNGTSGQLRTCLAFVQYLQHVMDHVHPYCPVEMNSLGEQVILVAEKRMKDVQSIFERHLENYYSVRNILEEQLSSTRAAERFQLKKAKKKRKGFLNSVIGAGISSAKQPLSAPVSGIAGASSTVSSEKGGDIIASQLPGYESRHLIGSAVESPMAAILKARSALGSLCSAFGECVSISSIYKNFTNIQPKYKAEPVITIRDRQYFIREYAREALFVWIRKHIRESVAHSSESVERPSIILAKYLQLQDVARFVGDHIGIDYAHLVKLISLEEICGKDCGEDIGGVPLIPLSESAQEHSNLFHNAGSAADLMTTSDDVNQSPRRALGMFRRSAFALGNGNSGGSSGGSDISARQFGSTLGAGTMSARLDSTLSSNSFLPRVSDIVSGWMAHFIEDIVPSGQNGVSGIIFSEYFGGFIKVSELTLVAGGTSNANKSRFQKIPRAEMWLDESELHSLLKLFGPRGLRVLDRSLLSIVSTFTEIVARIIENEEKAIKAVYLSLSRGRHELALRQSLRMRHIANNMATVLRVIGCTLCFRRLLGNIMQEVGLEMIPDIHRLLTRAEKLSNIHPESKDQGKKRLNTLVSFSGRSSDFKNDNSGKIYRSLPPELDPSLSTLIQHQLGIAHDPSPPSSSSSAASDENIPDLFDIDHDTWSLFPITIGILMCSDSWKSADIVLRFDALQNNNHTIALAVMQICDIIAPNQKQAKKMHKLAIHCASSIATQMRISTREEKSGNLEFKDYCFPGMMSFLQKLVDASSHTSFREEEESYNTVPYSLVRSAYLSRLLGKVHGNEEGMSADEFAKFLRDRTKMIADNLEVDEQQQALQAATTTSAENAKGP